MACECVVILHKYWWMESCARCRVWS